MVDDLEKVEDWVETLTAEKNSAQTQVEILDRDNKKIRNDVESLEGNDN